MSPRRRRFWFAAFAAVVVVAGLGVAAYFLWFRPALPGPDSPRYREYVENFEVGLAALDTERSLEIGGEKLTKAVQIIPEEPAGWADRGLMYLRDHQFDRAASDLARRTSWRRRAARSMRCSAGWRRSRASTPTPSAISARPSRPTRATSVTSTPWPTPCRRRADPTPTPSING